MCHRKFRLGLSVHIEPIDSLCFNIGAAWCTGGLLEAPWWVQRPCPQPCPFHLSDATLTRGATRQNPSCVLSRVHLVLQSPAQMSPALESCLGVAHLELISAMHCPGNVSSLEHFQHLRKKRHAFRCPPSPPVLCPRPRGVSPTACCLHP